MIGLTGPQRTGKSTLADAFAKANDIPYVATTASGVFEMMGLDPKKEYPLETRLLVQECILKTFESQYEEAARMSTMFISDRTPIDLASYALADVTRGTMVSQSPAVAVWVNEYVERCFKSSARFFGVIVQIQPGIPLVEAEGKAPADPAYMEHLNSLQLGLLTDERSLTRRFQMPRSILMLDDRLTALAKVVAGCMNKQEKVYAEETFH